MSKEKEAWAPPGFRAYVFLGHVHYVCKMCGAQFCGDEVDWAYHECAGAA